MLLVTYALVGSLLGSVSLNFDENPVGTTNAGFVYLLGLVLWPVVLIIVYALSTWEQLTGKTV